MKRNLYYKKFYEHRNLIRLVVQSAVIGLSHYPSLIIYVLFRRNMGERFYSLASSLTLAVVLLLPVALDISSVHINLSRYFDLPWILMVLVFVGFAVFRRLEFTRNTHSFNMLRFSYSEGELMPVWAEWDKKYPNLKLKPENIKKYYEPLAILLIGIVFQAIPKTGATGSFLILTAFLHAGKVHVEFARGREYILDHIDQIIINRELGGIFLPDETKESASGLSLKCPKPKDAELRKEIYKMMQDDNEGVEVS